jgi:hypothetical protein
MNHIRHESTLCRPALVPFNHISRGDKDIDDRLIIERTNTQGLFSVVPPVGWHETSIFQTNVAISMLTVMDFWHNASVVLPAHMHEFSLSALLHMLWLIDCTSSRRRLSVECP